MSIVLKSVLDSGADVQSQTKNIKNPDDALHSKQNFI